MAPSKKSVPGPAVPKKKLDDAAGLGADGPRTIKVSSTVLYLHGMRTNPGTVTFGFATESSDVPLIELCRGQARVREYRYAMRS